MERSEFSPYLAALTRISYQFGDHDTTRRIIQRFGRVGYTNPSAVAVVMYLKQNCPNVYTTDGFNYPATTVKELTDVLKVNNGEEFRALIFQYYRRYGEQPPRNPRAEPCA